MRAARARRRAPAHRCHTRIEHCTSDAHTPPPGPLGRRGDNPCELVRSQITDLTIRGAWTGPARLQLFEHALAPLADLPVREVVKATHLLTDLTLPRAAIAHDYLG